MVNQPAPSIAGEAEFWAGVANAQRFFMGSAEVQYALQKLTAVLDAAGIPYAIAGAMALNHYGYRRVTVDVDVLLTRDGLDRLKHDVLGRGYVEKFPGSKGLRDTEYNVAIDVLLAGDYPGDRKPKPVRFPDPASVAVHGEHGAFLPLETLIELKLASGLSAPHRLKDLADVLELIRATGLPATLTDRLDPSVRGQVRRAVGRRADPRRRVTRPPLPLAADYDVHGNGLARHEIAKVPRPPSARDHEPHLGG
jgi:hypothetical protein